MRKGDSGVIGIGGSYRDLNNGRKLCPIFKVSRSDPVIRVGQHVFRL